ASELTLQGSGHGRRHGLRTGAGEPSAYRDGGKVDLRQRGYGQDAEGNPAGERDGNGEQRGGNRPVNKWGGDIHGSLRGDGLHLATGLPVPREAPGQTVEEKVDYR